MTPARTACSKYADTSKSHARHSSTRSASPGERASESASSRSTRLLADPHRPARIFAGAMERDRRAALEAQTGLSAAPQASAERVDVLVYGVPVESRTRSSPRSYPDPDARLMRPRLLGGMIKAVGKPRLHGDHGRGRPRHLDRVAAVVFRSLGAHPTQISRPVWSPSASPTTSRGVPGTSRPVAGAMISTRSTASADASTQAAAPCRPVIIAAPKAPHPFLPTPMGPGGEGCPTLPF